MTAWGGAANKTLTTSKFLASAANGTYTLSFNSTCIGGAIVGGTILDALYIDKRKSGGYYE